MATVTDDFNRANGAPGANWSSALGLSDIVIATNAIDPGNTASRWAANTFDNDQAAWFQYVSTRGTSGPMVRGDETVKTCYTCEWWQFDGEYGGFQLDCIKYVNGTKSTIGTSYQTYGALPGWVRVTATGTSIVVATSTDGAAWTDRVTVTDSAISTGSAGILTAESAVDNWSATGAAAGGDPPAAPAVVWHRAHIINQLI